MGSAADEALLAGWAEAHGVYVKANTTVEVEVKGCLDAEPRKLQAKAGKCKIWVCRHCGHDFTISGAGLKKISDHAVTSAKLFVGKKAAGCPSITEEALQELVCLGLDAADSKLLELAEEAAGPTTKRQKVEAEDAQTTEKKEKREKKDRKKVDETNDKADGKEKNQKNDKKDKSEKKEKKDKGERKERKFKKDETEQMDDGSNDDLRPKDNEDKPDNAEALAPTEEEPTREDGEVVTENNQEDDEIEAEEEEEEATENQKKKDKKQKKDKSAKSYKKTKKDLKEKGQKDKKEKKSGKKDNKDEDEEEEPSKRARHGGKPENATEEASVSEAAAFWEAAAEDEEAVNKEAAQASTSEAAAFWEAAAEEEEVANKEAAQEQEDNKAPQASSVSTKLPAEEEVPPAPPEPDVTPELPPLAPALVADAEAIEALLLEEDLGEASDGDDDEPLLQTAVKQADDGAPEKSNKVMPLEPWEIESLSEPLGDIDGLPRMQSHVAQVVGARIDVGWGTKPGATIKAADVKTSRMAQHLLRLLLEERAGKAPTLQPGKRRPFCTVLQMPPAFPFAEGELHQLGAECGVVALRAEDLERAAKPQVFEFKPFDEIELFYGGTWCEGLIGAGKVGSESGVIVVTADGEWEVDRSTVRPKGFVPEGGGASLVAIFGTRQKRAQAHLRLAANVRAKHPMHDFGAEAAAALGPEGDWTTFEFRPGKEAEAMWEYWQGWRLPTTLAPAVGAVVGFVGGAAYASGNPKERSCACVAFKMVEQACKVGNWGSAFPDKLPAELSDCSVELKVPNAAYLFETFAYDLETEFGVLIFHAKEDPSVEQKPLGMGDTVTVNDQGRWMEGMIMELASEKGGQVVVMLSDGQSSWTVTQSEADLRPPARLGTLIVLGYQPFGKASARLRLMAKAAEAGVSLQVFGDELKVHTSTEPSLDTEVVAVPTGITPEILELASRRVARATRCCVQAFASNSVMVLYGDGDARERAKQCLQWVYQQNGDPACGVAFDPEDVNEHLYLITITESEKEVITAPLIQAIEYEAEVFVFMRDERADKKWEYEQKVEFKYNGSWEEGNFMRKVPGRKEYKIKYGRRAQDECNVAFEDVREPRDPLRKTALFVYSHDSGSTGESGYGLTEKRARELIRDAAGDAMTGQSAGMFTGAKCTFSHEKDNTSGNSSWNNGGDRNDWGYAGGNRRAY